MKRSPRLPNDIETTVSIALNEDVGSGDITAALLEETATAHARVLTREEAILCGTAWFDAVFRALDPTISVRWQHRDSDIVAAGATLCTLSGPSRALLTGERTALNFLQTLSATATQTQHCIKLLGTSKTRLLDTRKTLPGLRKAQKYAVRCGGGYNHRMGLFDAVLIKENHIRAAGSITDAVTNARKRSPGMSVEVEVENIDELDEAIAANVDIAMLDNFSVEKMRSAVERTAGRVALEASGGVEESQLRAIATTGVDYVSVGALTKHVQAIDFSMLFEELS